MDKETIKSILLANGFTIKPGETDLKPYVYKAAFELLELAAPAVQGEPVAVLYADGTVLTKAECGDSFAVCCKVQTPLYAAPQPAVQGEPVAEVVWPDVEGRRGGFRQYGQYSSPRLSAGIKLYTHPQPVEQQPMRAADRQENVSGGWRSRFLRLMGEMQSELDDSNEDPIPSELWSLWRELLDTTPKQGERLPELAKYQPCGCVICTCEHETQCQGCGGHHCGTHPVGRIPAPAYIQAAEQHPTPCVGCEGAPAPENSPCAVCGQQLTPDVSALVKALARCRQQASYTIGGIEALQNQLNKIRDIANEALAAHFKRDSQPCPAIQEGYAGATVWIGDKRVTQVVTEGSLKYESETGMAITHAAQACLDLIAAAHRKGE